MSTQPYEPRPHGRPAGARKRKAGAELLILPSFLFLVFEGLSLVADRLHKKSGYTSHEITGRRFSRLLHHLSPMHCLVIELRSNHPRADTLWALC